MNDIVDRLRDATRAVGETIDQVPAFSPDARRTVRGKGGSTAGRPRPWRWGWAAVPVAAGVSVMAVVAAGTVVARWDDGAVTLSAGATAGPAAEPRFFVHLDGGAITVRDVSDGSVTARLPRPGKDESFSAVQAAQDNRLFYAASADAGCGARLYRFTLDDGGKIASYASLPYRPPAGAQITSLAVSGDGTKLAYGLAPCRTDGPPGSLVIIDTATGHSRTWTSRNPAGVRDVSMSADGRYVVFRRYCSARGGVIVRPPVPAPSTSSPAPKRVSEVATAHPSPAAPASAPAASPPGRPRSQVEFAVTVPPAARPGPVATPGAVPAIGSDCVLFSARGDEGSSTVRLSPSGRAAGSPGRPPGASDVVEASSSAEGWVWYGPDEVSVLDTASTSGSLDRARTLHLGGMENSLIGAVVTPDGRRLVAAGRSMRPVPANGTPKASVAIEKVVAYDIADGRLVEVLYAGRDGWTLGLDIDGTGRNVLAVRHGEIGVLGESGFRVLVKGYGVVRRPLFGTVAW